MRVPSRFRGGVDECGLKTSPAACLKPHESEPHAGGEVGRSQAGHEPCPAAWRMPAESEPHARREVDQRQTCFWQMPALARISDRKCFMIRASARVCGLVANFDSLVECKLLSPLLWDKGTLEAKQRVRVRGSAGGNTPHPNPSREGERLKWAHSGYRIN